MPSARPGARSLTAVKDVERYLSKVPPDARATLKKVRATIRAAAPSSEEGLSYGAPAFRHKGRPLAGYAATKDHCSFYLFSTAVLAAHREDLAKYDVTKGTIRYPIGRPLPATIIRKLMKARMKEIEAGTKY